MGKRKPLEGLYREVKGQYQGMPANLPTDLLYIKQKHLFLISHLYQGSGFHWHYETTTIPVAPKWLLSK